MNERANDRSGSISPATAVGGVARRVVDDKRGAVFVEFLIAFLPVQVFFLCLIQSAILYTVRLVTEHAAITAARAAAVVIGDEPKTNLYGQDAATTIHTVQQGNDSGRRKPIRDAALLIMAPLILKGIVQSVDVYLPPGDQPAGNEPNQTQTFTPMGDKTVTKIRVRVEVEAACRIGFASQIVCSSLLQTIAGSEANKFWLPTRRVRAEAIYPYQGARYDY